MTVGEEIPNEVLRALVDESVTKWGNDVMFERVCLSAYLHKYYPQYFKSYETNENALQKYLNSKGWKCSLVWSAYMGLPLSLKAVGEALKLSQQKMDKGKYLIKNALW